MANVGLFRRFAAAESIMMRGVMPKTNAREVEQVRDERVREVLATRAGVRLVKVVPVLTATLSERMVG